MSSDRLEYSVRGFVAWLARNEDTLEEAWAEAGQGAAKWFVAPILVRRYLRSINLRIYSMDQSYEKGERLLLPDGFIDEVAAVEGGGEEQRLVMKSGPPKLHAGVKSPSDADSELSTQRAFYKFAKECEVHIPDDPRSIGRRGPESVRASQPSESTAEVSKSRVPVSLPGPPAKESYWPVTDEGLQDGYVGLSRMGVEILSRVPEASRSGRPRWVQVQVYGSLEIVVLFDPAHSRLSGPAVHDWYAEGNIRAGHHAYIGSPSDGSGEPPSLYVDEPDCFSGVPLARGAREIAHCRHRIHQMLKGRGEFCHYKAIAKKLDIAEGTVESALSANSHLFQSAAAWSGYWGLCIWSLTAERFKEALSNDIAASHRICTALKGGLLGRRELIKALKSIYGYRVEDIRPLVPLEPSPNDCWRRNGHAYELLPGVTCPANPAGPVESPKPRAPIDPDTGPRSSPKVEAASLGSIGRASVKVPDHGLVLADPGLSARRKWSSTANGDDLLAGLGSLLERSRRPPRESAKPGPKREEEASGGHSDGGSMGCERLVDELPTFCGVDSGRSNDLGFPSVAHSIHPLAPAPDAVLGRYRLLERVGAGGMSEVFSAEDSVLHCRVAVKVIHDPIARDPSFVERFLCEARLLASLEHPNVLPVHDFGTGRIADEDVSYVVMPFVAGGTLRRGMQSASPQIAVSWLSAIGGALDHAHSRGILHRDMKPGNVLLDSTGRALVTDFRLAQSASAASGTTDTVMGTPLYMAPEQAMGRPLDATADQYALAVMGFEMLTGRPPFTGDSPEEILHQHVHGAPPSVTSLAPGLPRAVDAVIARALAKEPGARFPNCRAFVGALAAALGVPFSAPPGVYSGEPVAHAPTAPAPAASEVSRAATVAARLSGSPAHPSAPASGIQGVFGSALIGGGLREGEAEDPSRRTRWGRHLAIAALCLALAFIFSRTQYRLLSIPMAIGGGSVLVVAILRTLGSMMRSNPAPQPEAWLDGELK